MKYAVIDIETRPRDDAEQYFKFKPPGNIKDPEKLKAKFVEQKAKFIENAALNRSTAAICAIGYIDDTGETVIHYAFDEKMESAILRKFWERLLTHKVYGWNFAAFDLPMIVTRSRILRVPGRMGYDGSRWSSPMTNKIVDVMLEATCQQYGEMMSLEDAAKLFDCRSDLRKAECKSEEFWTMISSNDEVSVSKAENHLKADLQETLELAKLFNLLQS